MTGDARTRGEQEWRYYACPVANRRVTTNAAGESTPVRQQTHPGCSGRGRGATPDRGGPAPGGRHRGRPGDAQGAARQARGQRGEGKRRRLEKALESLRKQHQWGDLSDDDYRAERREIEAALATLPARGTDTLVAFDEARARLLSMPEAIAAASPERRAEIVGLLVERVTATRQTGLTGLEWTAPAAPFFRLVLSERAVWDSNPRHED